MQAAIVTDQPQAKDMGFDYSLVNTAGFVTDATWIMRRSVPRFGMVIQRVGCVTGNPTPRSDKMSGEGMSSSKLLTGWITKGQ